MGRDTGKSHAFSKRGKDARNEEVEAQGFSIEFLYIFGANDPTSVGNFEYKAPCRRAKPVT